MTSQESTLNKYYSKIQETVRQEYASLNRRTLREPEIIFIGDSIIHLFPIEELLVSRKVIANRGISAYTTRDLLTYLDIHVFGQAVEEVFILIGTNDIGMGIPTTETLANLSQIITQLQKDYPSIMVKLLSILPINQEQQFSETVGLRTNQAIAELNQAYAHLLTRFELVELLPVPMGLVDEIGQLKLEVTKDGLHLNQAGYQILARDIQTQLT
ncbi:GDSL-type esterase/lipase family protein [Streptococcus caprae]|uniref:GDSL-type esterase/lipase family protein n=1 Tax=Streptococcus caprae TaxID=1640501 RepID=A0ABV8CTR1_9STRE